MTARANLFTRDDTFLGVCQGLGEDLRFSPDLLRVALALMLFWNPVATVALYAALGVLVLATRLAWPTRRRPAAVEPAPAPAAGNDAGASPLAEAA